MRISYNIILVLIMGITLSQGTCLATQHMTNNLAARTHIYMISRLEIKPDKTGAHRHILNAYGTTRTGGWSEPQLLPVLYETPPEDGIWDYHFTARKPAGPITQTITPISASTPIDLSETYLKGIRVIGETNNKVIMLK